jgi:hypothetical protein
MILVIKLKITKNGKKFPRSEKIPTVRKNFLCLGQFFLYLEKNSHAQKKFPQLAELLIDPTQPFPWLIEWLVDLALT